MDKNSFSIAFLAKFPAVSRNKCHNRMNCKLRSGHTGSFNSHSNGMDFCCSENLNRSLFIGRLSSHFFSISFSKDTNLSSQTLCRRQRTTIVHCAVLPSNQFRQQKRSEWMGNETNKDSARQLLWRALNRCVCSHVLGHSMRCPLSRAKG